MTVRDSDRHGASPRERAADPSDRVETTVLPPSDVGLLDGIQRFLARHPEPPGLVASDGSTTRVPDEVHELLRRVVDALARGEAVRVVPDTTRLTVNEAASMLNVSRGTLNHLLDSGAIPHVRHPRRRSLRLGDVLAYRRAQASAHDASPAELTRRSVADGLDGDASGDYADVFREARHSTYG